MNISAFMVQILCVKSNYHKHAPSQGQDNIPACIEMLVVVKYSGQNGLAQHMCVGEAPLGLIFAPGARALECVNPALNNSHVGKSVDLLRLLLFTF